MSSEIPTAPEDKEMAEFKASLGSEGEIMTKDMLEEMLLFTWAMDISRQKVAESLDE